MNQHLLSNYLQTRLPNLKPNSSLIIRSNNNHNNLVSLIVKKGNTGNDITYTLYHPISKQNNQIEGYTINFEDILQIENSQWQFLFDHILAIKHYTDVNFKHPTFIKTAFSENISTVLNIKLCLKLPLDKYEQCLLKNLTQAIKFLAQNNQVSTQKLVKGIIPRYYYDEHENNFHHFIYKTKHFKVGGTFINPAFFSTTFEDNFKDYFIQGAGVSDQAYLKDVQDLLTDEEESLMQIEDYLNPLPSIFFYY